LSNCSTPRPFCGGVNDGSRTEILKGQYRTLTESPQPYLLYPLAQAPTDDLTLVAQAKHDHASALAAIRREVRALDPDMPLLDVKTMEQQMAKVLFLPQAMTALAGPAAGLAMVIAAIGLYGVIAYPVSRRTREFGIKLAIGAQSRDVIRQVMSQGLAIVGVGVGLGGVAALAVGRVMKGVLVGVGSTDPAAFAGALGVLVGVVALAIYLPARRASRVDPLAALRQE
jgi:predicted lysophospholipase L1 biosynthesis ABC-type transport system permease subunit